MIRRLMAGAGAGIILVLAAPSITSAQEAPAPVTLPCAIGAWLENGIRDSADVQCLQTVLLAKGIDTGPVDGWFGPVTQGAVESFQTAAGIVADGEVGPETATALGADMVGAYTGVPEDPTADSQPEPQPQPQRQQRQQARSSSNSQPRNSGGGGGASGVNWDNVARCESGSDWNAGLRTNHVGTFSGGLMIMKSAWLQYGGGEFAPHAGAASREQQIIVAERIAARVGAARAWECPVG